MTVNPDWWLLRLARWARWRYCRHDWHTVRFQHVKEGVWAVNQCSKCQRHIVHGIWAMPYSNKGRWR